TELSLDVGLTHDLVGQVFQGAARSIDGRDLSDRGLQGTLTGLVISAGWSQVLTPRLTLSVGYDLGILEGLLSNPYRTVPIGANTPAERHPDERIRHTLYARLAFALEESRTSFHALYRAYLDSWDIAALTPELRIYQEIGDI